MSNEVPEISLKDMLLVPEGPPAGVWERALEATFAAPPEADGADPAFPAVAGAAAGTEAGMDADVDDGDDTDADGVDDADADGPTYDFQPMSGPQFDGDDPGSGAEDPYSEGEVQGDVNDAGF